MSGVSHHSHGPVAVTMMLTHILLGLVVVVMASTAVVVVVLRGHETGRAEDTGSHPARTIGESSPQCEHYEP